ncbi:hypothetical protein KKC45_00400 [Patescibacteria group bacterium]|nr:hypothetical protein [Patescibacteria group bacterium]
MNIRKRSPEELSLFKKATVARGVAVVLIFLLILGVYYEERVKPIGLKEFCLNFSLSDFFCISLMVVAYGSICLIGGKTCYSYKEITEEQKRRKELKENL